MNTTKDKAIKSFYLSYKKAHELIENEISYIDDNLYRASRLVDRIIVVLFINQEILYIKNDIFELINKAYDGELLSQKISMFYENPSELLEYIRVNSINSLDNIDEIENKIKLITSLFPIDEYERNIFIKDDIIKNIINIFFKYNWRLDSLNTVETNLSVNPDILGSVFEKYINKRESGAYYTEIDTINYISNNSVLLTLYNKLNYKDEVLYYIKRYISEKDIYKIEDLIIENLNLIELTKNIIDIIDSEKIIRDFIDTLDTLKILDPTCGTGAFLVAVANMLEELYGKLYSRLSILTDCDIPTKGKIIVNLIQNNLYGVDIMEDAIDIAKFRLYLKVLQDIKDDNDIQITNIKLNLKSGNTLVGSIKNDEIMDLIALTTDENIEFNTNSFNWNEEFYEVINSGGFDCIIGNPPYVEYSKIKKVYKIENYITEKCKNIYAYVIERSINLLKKDGVIGFIVPISIVSTPRMKPLRKFIEYNCNEIFYSNFGDRPGTLFNGVHQKLTILIAKKNRSENHNIYTSQYYHWYNDERNQLFNNLKYIKNEYREEDFYYKFGNKTQVSILNKINNVEKPINNMINDKGEFDVYWNDRMTFWMKCFKGEKKSNSFKKSLFNTIDEAWIFVAVMNSSLYYFFWEMISDVWHITKKELELFKFNSELLNESQKEELINLAKLLENDLEKNKEYIGSKQVDYEYKHKKSKIIIDKIDTILAEYYDLTDEEYKYIIDYNLKYRMNDELETYLNKRNQSENLTTEEN